MKSKGFEEMICSVAGALGAVEDRWGLLIIRDLLFGLRRYDELRKSTGITHATLSGRLKKLEETGVITRRLYQKKPDRYEYHLTPKGQALEVVIMALAQVGDTWNSEDLPGPPIRFVNGATGHDLKLKPVDEKTGAIVRIADVRIEAGPGADDLAKWRITKRTKG